MENSLGCGFRELGLKVPSNRRIPDKDITASSQRVQGRAAYRGRIGVETMGIWEDGWCSSQTDTAPYFQVFFGEFTFINLKKKMVKYASRQYPIEQELIPIYVAGGD